MLLLNLPFVSSFVRSHAYRRRADYHSQLITCCRESLLATPCVSRRTMYDARFKSPEPPSATHCDHTQHKHIACGATEIAGVDNAAPSSKGGHRGSGHGGSGHYGSDW